MPDAKREDETVQRAEDQAGKVNQGSVILALEAAGAAAPAPASSSLPLAGGGSGRELPAANSTPPQPSPARGGSEAAPVAAGSYTGAADVECDVLVLGAGPGGYSAAFRAADLGMKTVLVEIVDSGCGIPKERLDTIFEDFVTTKRRGTESR